MYSFLRYIKERPYKSFKKKILTAFLSPKTIVEVGAYNGELIDKCDMRGYKLYMFEPDPEMFRVIQGNIEKMGSKNILALNKAVSDYNGKAKFYISNNKCCSSLNKFNNEHKFWDDGIINNIHTVGEIKVDVTRLDRFMKDQKIEKIDFLEIDAQGEDFRIVQSLGKKIKDVKRIQIEVWIKGPTQYIAQFTREDIVNYMNHNGFVIEKSWKQTFEREENIIFKNYSF